jgi:hypothetical protein
VQRDARDRLEVLKFELMEETIGSWMRATIRRLEKKQGSACNQKKQPSAHQPHSGVQSR